MNPKRRFSVPDTVKTIGLPYRSWWLAIWVDQYWNFGGGLRFTHHIATKGDSALAHLASRSPQSTYGRISPPNVGPQNRPLKASSKDSHDLLLEATRSILVSSRPPQAPTMITGNSANVGGLIPYPSRPQAVVTRLKKNDGILSYPTYTSSAIASQTSRTSTCTVLVTTGGRDKNFGSLMHGHRRKWWLCYMCCSGIAKSPAKL